MDKITMQPNIEKQNNNFNNHHCSLQKHITNTKTKALDTYNIIPLQHQSKNKANKERIYNCSAEPCKKLKDINSNKTIFLPSSKITLITPKP